MTFTDLKGTSWEVPFTVHQALRIKSVLGVDLAQIAESKDAGGELAALSGDMERMVNILFLCCERQAKDLGVSDVDFAERLDLAIFGDALDAFTASFVDFFLKGPARERGRALMAKRRAITSRQVEAERQKVVSALESFVSASDSPASAE